MSRIKNKKLFLTLYWVLSFTWALPTTLLGGLVALGLLIKGHKPKRYCCALCFPLGSDWGLELGLFFIGSKDEDEKLKQHEFGHHLQACFLLGPLTLFVATIPSILRYWIREAETSIKRGVVIFTFFFAMTACFVGAVLIPSIVRIVLPFLILVYMLATVDWLIWLKNRYESYGHDDYDDFWVEADATRRGKEISEKFFKTP